MAKSKVLTIEERDIKELQIPPAVAMDPRKSRFLIGYFHLQSPTYGNAYQSAVAAGFSHEYAECITYQKPQWLSDFLGMQSLGVMAENHMTEVLALSNIQPVIGAFGPVTTTITEEVDTGTVYKTGKKKGQPVIKKLKRKVPVMKHDTALIKAKNEVAKLVLPAYKPEIYGKKEGPKFSFSYNRTEIVEKYKPATWLTTAPS